MNIIKKIEFFHRAMMFWACNLIVMLQSQNTIFNTKQGLISNITKGLFFVLISWSYTTYATSVIKVEAKEFDGQTVFVFYHDRSINLRTNFHTNLATVVANKPIRLELIGSGSLQKLAGSFTVSKDGLGFSFPTKNKYAMDGRIDGEKLTAIKLKVKNDNSSDAQDGVKTEITEHQDAIIKITETAAIDSKVTESDLPRKAGTPVKISQKGDAASLQFPIKGKPRFALWRRGKYIWLAIDTYIEFSPPKTDLIEDFKQIDNDITLIRIEAAKFMYANASIASGSLSLSLTQTPVNGAITLPFDATEDTIKFNNYFTGSKIIAVQDPDIGDEMRAIMTSTPGAFVTTPNALLDFQILPSFHGLAVLLRADDVSIELGKNDITIASNYQAPDTATQVTATAPTLSHNQPKISSILPIITNDLLIKSYTPIQSHLWQSIAASPNEISSYGSKLDLAQFYFMHGMYHESLAMLQIAHTLNPKDFDKNTAMILQNAVTLSMLGHYKDAKVLYDQLSAQYTGASPDEIAIFRNYNEYMLGNMPTTIGFINALNQFVNLYPEDLYWPLAFAEIDLCLQNNNLRTLESLFKSLRTSNNLQISDSLKLYKATYYRKKNQINLAKQLLGELIRQNADPYNATRAEIELVKLLNGTEEIDAKEAIKKLDKLRFSWRGDKVEFDLLMTLAEFYKEDNDFMNAIRTYKYAATAFNGQFQYFYILSEMAKIYNSIFLPGGTAEKMNDFDAVALFYEFRDMTPIGVDGDNVILMIAKRLINLDLLDTAAQLLKHQVDYRLVGNKRVISADHLALVLIMANKPEEALKILNETDADTKTIKEHIYREQLKAKALMDSGKYADALIYLPDEDNDPISKTMRKEIYFKSKKWADYIDSVAPDVEKSLKDVIAGDSIQDVLRLAISYSMLSKTAELEALQTTLKTDNDQLKAVIDFLLATNQPVDYRNIDKSLKIDQMRSFLNDSKQRLFR